jgi:hypothetical protein
MKDLIDLALRYDPTYAGKIRGAGAEEIARLERLAGTTLPPAYRSFLSVMGRSMGDVGVATVSFSIDSILPYYEDPAESGAWVGRYLLFGEHLQDPYHHSFLDLETVRDGDCRVVSFDGTLESPPEEPLQQAESLHAFLLPLFFSCKALGRFEHRATATLVYPLMQARRTGAPATLARFQAVAVRMGFQIIPGGSPAFVLLDRDDAAIYAAAGAPGLVAVALGARDAATALKLREIFSDDAARG